jgi:membrane protein YdbS with pleckstrin-like domain
MYRSFRNVCERLLRIPSDPEPPPGDEASTQIFRAAPNYYKYLMFLWALTTAPLLIQFVVSPFIIIALIHFKVSGAPVFIALVLLALALHIVTALFHLALVRLNFEKRWYIVTDRSLRIREGVTTVREMTVNFANIQNISISQGPLQRVLAICDLRVDTAGGGGNATTRHGQNISQNLHTAWFRGIQNANQVRQLIQDRLRHLKDSGLGDHEERGHSSIIPSPDFLTALRSIHAEAKLLHGSLQRPGV